jgi:hypothetical protein
MLRIQRIRRIFSKLKYSPDPHDPPNPRSTLRDLPMNLTRCLRDIQVLLFV